LTLCQASLDKHLHEVEIKWDPRAALGVVLAAAGYPNSYPKGDAITLPENSANAKVFHAGTKIENDKLVTAGGRVLCACALGDDIAMAQQNAYQLVEQINWDGMYYRKDIGHRAL